MFKYEFYLSPSCVQRLAGAPDASLFLPSKPTIVDSFGVSESDGFTAFLTDPSQSLTSYTFRVLQYF